MTSWKPLTPGKLQSSLLWICRQLLILWNILYTSSYRLHHTFGLLGYVISWIRTFLTDRSSIAKLICHLHLPPPYSQACLTLCSWSTSFVIFISPIANVINHYITTQFKSHNYNEFLKRAKFESKVKLRHSPVCNNYSFRLS